MAKTKSALVNKEVATIEREASRRGLNLLVILAKAEISQPTWWRWREGKSGPHKAMWDKLLAQLPRDLRALLA